MLGELQPPANTGRNPASVRMRDFRPLVALNLDVPLFHRAPVPHAFCIFWRAFFLRQTDADKACDERDGFVAAMGGRAFDVHPTAILGRLAGSIGSGISRRRIR